MSPPLLRAVDLFSGVGGMTLALGPKGANLVRTVAYCDIDPNSRNVLVDNMRRGRLPEGPICPDVAVMSRKWLNDQGISPAIDAVLAGFPCTGFSAIGRKAGFRDGQSSLFFELVRVLRDLRPSVVFLENVPEIVKKGLDVVRDILQDEMGFELRWCILGAHDVGAPHRRMRWFCLGIKSSSSSSRLFPASFRQPFKQSKALSTWTREPARTDIHAENVQRTRISLLGNAVVPECVRQAFLHLISEFHEPQDSPSQSLRPAATNDRPIVTTLDPTAYRPPPGFHLQNVHRPLREPIRIQFWSTPRRSCSWASHVLTERTIRDLGTQVRFAVDTPDNARGRPLSAEFVEWLMGYPAGWTRHAISSIAAVFEGPLGATFMEDLICQRSITNTKSTPATRTHGPAASGTGGGRASICTAAACAGSGWRPGTCAANAGPWRATSS